MLNTPFSPWPSFTPEEIEAVSAVLASNRVNYWTGDRCREFERRFADWVGTATRWPCPMARLLWRWR